MADFTSGFWDYYITVLTLLGVVGCAVLLWAQSEKKVSVPAGSTPGQNDTGHVWDEDLKELNTPMPRWWIILFYLTIFFGLAYLFLYPGLGSYAGKLGWKSSGAYQEELQKADAEYGPLFNKYLQQDLKAVAADPQAHAIGERLFITYCSQCHGSDARGDQRIGSKNLTDKIWLFGGEPATIETTILNGRTSVMPPMGAAVGSDQDVENVANYVLSLSGSDHDAAKASQGKEKFAVCAACHGPEGLGNPAIGSKNLTDKIWLFGGSMKAVTTTIQKGRTGTMPPFKDFLGEAKVHVLAAYVWSLSNEPGSATK